MAAGAPEGGRNVQPAEAVQGAERRLERQARTDADPSERGREMNREKIIETLDKKIAHAKNEDCDFVYIPVWQAKQIAEYLTQPEIVRCKDCKYYDLKDGRCFNRHSTHRERMCSPKWFCADGEHR